MPWKYKKINPRQLLRLCFAVFEGKQRRKAERPIIIHAMDEAAHQDRQPHTATFITVPGILFLSTISTKPSLLNPSLQATQSQPNQSTTGNHKCTGAHDSSPRGQLLQASSVIKYLGPGMSATEKRKHWIS